jgi:hypothetical protein
MLISKHSIDNVRFLAITLAFFCLLGWNSSSSASDSTQELLNSIARLNVQLGSDDTAEGWRRFLQLNRLESQAAKGEQGDLATLKELHQRLSTATQSNQFQPFDDLRTALENHIQVLGSAQGTSLEEMLKSAPSQYRAIDIPELERQRDALKSDVAQFKAFSAAQPFRETRATAQDSLKLSELEQLLTEMQFELAPEISEGKIVSALQELQKQLNEVRAKIDAMPSTEEELGPEDQDDENSEQNESAQETEPRQAQDDNLENLKAEENALREKFNELNKKRADIRRQDLPRKRKRAEYLKLLYEIENRFSKAQMDLGDPYTASAQFSLEKFSRLYGFGTEDNLQEEFLKRIDRLVQELPKLSNSNDRRAYAVVGNTLEWLEHTGQVPHLVTAIRARHSFPNAYLQISGQFINRLGARPVNQTRPVNEVIKGKTVTGVAHTTGTVNFDFIADPDQVHISIRNLNQINSDTQLEAGPLRVFIQANGMAEARRSVVANIGGLHEDAACGAANMDARFCGTSSACNIVNNIAAKKFAESKADGDQRASRKVRKELIERFTEETDKALDQGKESLGRIKSTALNFYSMMPALYLHSTHDRINLIGKRHSRWNLAAPCLPPTFQTQNDVELRIHDSLLSNYLEPFFRGKTFTNEELANELKRLLKTDDNLLAPKPAVDGQQENKAQENPEADEPFSITFSNIRPIQFELEQNRFTVVVSATRFTRADRSINAGLTITIKFRIVKQGGELFLVRDGKAELDYIEGQEKDAELVAFRSILSGKLNPEGQAEAKTKLPANLLPIEQMPALQNRPAARNLQLSQFRMEDGWLSVGWNHVPDGGIDMRPRDLPAISSQEAVSFSDSDSEARVEPSTQASFGASFGG